MSHSVQGKMARGAAWMVLLTMFERSLGLISTLILVRLLSPADFGVTAMAGSFIYMAQMLSAFGFDIALIQNQSATDSHYHTAWTFNVLLGLFILVLMVGMAGPIADFYRHPEVFPVVCALALGPLIAGCENIGVVAFRKELEFRKEFLFQISRKFIGFAVTIPVAFWLRNYWALVAGMLAARLAGTVTSYIVHPFRPRLSVVHAAAIVRFSKWLLLNNALSFLKERASDFVIGRLSGAAALGVYNVSSEFAHLPTTEIGAPINRALLPGFAKLSDTDEVRAAHVNALRVLGIIAIPAAAGLAAVAPYFIPVVLGEKWVDGVALMQVLAVNGAFLMFQSSICSVLIGTGHPEVVTKTNAVFVLLLLILLVALTPSFGAIGAACATLGTTIVTMPIYLYQLRSRIGIPMLTFVAALSRPVAASVLMVLVVRSAVPDHSATMPTFEAVIWLVTSVLVGAATYVVAASILWLSLGRPAGAERFVLDAMRSGLGRILRNRRNSA